MIVPGMFVCSSFLISVCMFIVSKALLISSATVIVRAGGAKSRKVNTGVPQGSKLSPSLFSFYIADMPIPTEPVKWVCYADDITGHRG